jgi:hypothetical protein
MLEDLVGQLLDTPHESEMVGAGDPSDIILARLKRRDIGPKRLLPGSERLLPDLKRRDIGPNLILPGSE